MRAAWTDANFDRSKIKFYTNESGFILGLSKLGDRLGVDGADVEVEATFTGINITHATSVESGLFVHRDVSVCTVTATMPEHQDLMDQRLAIKYDDKLLFKGTVREVEWTETMNGGQYWLPGNTATKTFSVSMTITAGDEEFADSVTPPINFTTTQVEGRVGGWLGLDVDASHQDPADDLNRWTYQNVLDIGSTYVSISPEDTDNSSLADTLRDNLKIINQHYVYKPWDGVVEVSSNSRWHSGTNAEDCLFFSDNAGDDSQTGGDEYTHNDRFVIYSSRQYGYDASLFQGSAQVKVNDPLDGGEQTFGPFRASDIHPSDPTVDLGKQSVFTGYSKPLARNYIATLPLKVRREPFTKSIEMPLQSYRQIDDVQVPGMALLNHDGTVDKVAVLGVSHNISQTTWTVSYTLGPHHLLDRESDYDPSVPQNAYTTISGGTVTVHWFTPNSLPSDVTLYRYVFQTADPLGPSVSWSTDISVSHFQKVDGELPGDPQSATFVGSGPYYVAYTSDPNPGSGVVNLSYRQGQPAFAAVEL